MSRQQTLGRYVCGASIERDEDAFRALLRFMIGDSFQRSSRYRCTLEQHDGEHHACVYDPGKPQRVSLWLRWANDRPELSLRWVRDCPAASEAGDGCCQYIDHQGGHTWEVTDPEHDMFQAIAPALEELFRDPS
ncbi:hypothetical protein LG634_18740 [Streptomyces bambusae]|uniref:hypothetical protein n=1 Tax=Streptomyces bambusae TaxID=1550616 RepID=UPI001CFDFC6C|nr:hypothetical protein [Streptomyces bambusae]MCB5166872.1 hypothetical protein [Streptomyces bambusae]